MDRTVWVSDSDLNGLDTVARITKVDGNYYLEVTNKSSMTLGARIKAAWRVLTGRTALFSFVILSDNDNWVRGFDNGGKDS